MKHIIIFFSALLLVFSTLFVLREIRSEEEFSKLCLGYPVCFLEQDFSHYLEGDGLLFFPVYEKIKLNDESLPIRKIYPLNLILSFFSVFVVLEVWVYFLEYIYFKYFKLRKNRLEGKN